MKLEMIYTQNIVLTKESCETHALALENWYVSYHQCRIGREVTQIGHL